VVIHGCAVDVVGANHPPFRGGLLQSPRRFRGRKPDIFNGLCSVSNPKHAVLAKGKSSREYPDAAETLCRDPQQTSTERLISVCHRLRAVTYRPDRELIDRHILPPSTPLMLSGNLIFWHSRFQNIGFHVAHSHSVPEHRQNWFQRAIESRDHGCSRRLQFVLSRHLSPWRNAQLITIRNQNCAHSCGPFTRISFGKDSVF